MWCPALGVLPTFLRFFLHWFDYWRSRLDRYRLKDLIFSRSVGTTTYSREPLHGRFASLPLVLI